MRDLCVLNLACNYCNLHLFDAQRHIISHQHSGLFVHVWHTYGKHMWHRCMAMCVVHLCVCSCMCVRHDPDTCKNEMSREKWYSTCLLPSCRCVLLLCGRVWQMYRYISSILLCTRMLLVCAHMYKKKKHFVSPINE